VAVASKQLAAMFHGKLDWIKVSWFCSAKLKGGDKRLLLKVTPVCVNKMPHKHAQLKNHNIDYSIREHVFMSSFVVCRALHSPVGKIPVNMLDNCWQLLGAQ